MNNNQTNIGVQLMPLLLIAASLGFYICQGVLLSASCFILAMATWSLLWSDNKNHKN